MRLSDTKLLRLSLFVSFLGLFGLILLFSLSEIHLISVQDAEGLLDGDEVRVEGRILSASVRGNTTFLVIEQSCTIDAIVFEKVDVKEGLFVDVSGTMDSYNNKKEIIVDEIIVHSS